MSIALMTLIALWCGNPVKDRLYVDSINKCRKNFIKCLDESPRKGKIYPETIANECIRKIELGN